MFLFFALSFSFPSATGRELLVGFEQKHHALCIIGEGGLAIAGIHSAVEGLKAIEPNNPLAG